MTNPTLDQKAIRQIAHLARLTGGTNEDLLNLQEDLNNIVKMVGQITDANTQGISPMSHSVETSQFLREDTVTAIDGREKLQKLAPQVEAALYLVPPVIEDNENNEKG